MTPISVVQKPVITNRPRFLSNEPQEPSGLVAKPRGIVRGGVDRVRMQLQVDPASGLFVYVAGVAWNGAGFPVQVPIAIPPDAALVDNRVFAQGLIFDPWPNAARPLGITDAIEICIRR